ncbi:MAG: TrkH family potassium uptake protein [Saprospiraceae bacterium]|nr:TrkH family potassium uptake protein [Saprospiraceae bacterium]
MILFRDAGHVLGILLIILGAGMLICLPVSLFYRDAQHNALLLSSGVTVVAGFLLFRLRRRTNLQINKRTGYLVVTMGWIGISLFSMLPYLFSGSLQHVADAFFESMSGFSTTGASVIADVENVAPSLLFWRSFTQWIGGMGIIVLSVAILPLLGIGGIELFVAEAPGPTSDKIHPRIQETAKRLWYLYVGLTFAAFALLYGQGMSGFDAINHAMTTMATGGFSTRNASIAYWDHAGIQYTIVLFMFLAGTNFTILYFFITGRWRRAWASSEFRSYLLGTALLVFLAITLFPLYQRHFSEQAFRDILFQVISIITTTGFVTADYTSWGSALTFIFFLLMFSGASAGSTAGGIKIVRHMVFLKNSWLEFKRIIHPRGMVRIKVDGQVVAPRILTHIMVFLLVYMATFGLGTLALTATGVDLVSAGGAVATCLGNIGPGIGNLGPMDNFSGVPDAGKWILGFMMLLGRLELFTVLVLFTPFFWRAN